MNRFHPLNSRLRLMPVFLCVFFLTATNALAQHAHIYAGATSQSPGAGLFFQNGNAWDINSYGGSNGSPACLYFENNLPEIYPGLYQSATTFSSLPATVFGGGPSAFAAALGSYIEMKFVSLQGPTGGSLTVWNELEDRFNPTLLFEIPVGTTNGANQFNLSENDPFDPTSDPAGHIHGRRFALSKPGLYTIGLQLVDTSSNGPNGGPIHTPSPVTYFYLQAGLSLGDFSKTNDVASARFGLPGLKDFVFEATSVLPATNWVTITNIIGTSHSELRWVIDPEATEPARFYRIREATAE